MMWENVMENRVEMRENFFFFPCLPLAQFIFLSEKMDHATTHFRSCHAHLGPVMDTRYLLQAQDVHHRTKSLEMGSIKMCLGTFGHIFDGQMGNQRINKDSSVSEVPIQKRVVIAVSDRYYKGVRL
jgi:hypothetical protein